MPLRYERRITRAMLRSEAGGRDAGEPNAVGIPTKNWPARDEGAYFTDQDRDRFWAVALPRFVRLREHLEAGGAVVWPADGIGTGLAELPRRAPRIWADLERARLKLEAIG